MVRVESAIINASGSRPPERGMAAFRLVLLDRVIELLTFWLVALATDRPAVPLMVALPIPLNREIEKNLRNITDTLSTVRHKNEQTKRWE